MVDEFSFYDIAEGEYTDSEAILFVECIMSRNIDPEWELKCITALAINLGLDEELYEVPDVLSESEGEDMNNPFGMLMPMEGPNLTSDFNEWVEKSMELIVYQKRYQDWIQLYFVTCLKYEKYEILHRLDIHKRFNVK